MREYTVVYRWTGDTEEYTKVMDRITLAYFLRDEGFEVLSYVEL